MCSTSPFFSKPQIKGLVFPYLVLYTFSPFKWFLAEQDSSTIVVCALSGHNLSISKQHLIKLSEVQNTSLKFLSQYVTRVILDLDEHQVS